jgi:aryl carrier-like protein
MNQANQEQAKNQANDPEAVRKRIHLMQLDHPSLDYQHLAKKLRRSGTAITFALQAKRPQLLARIVRYLNWLDRQRAKKLRA